jgi:hypothetical protein
MTRRTPDRRHITELVTAIAKITRNLDARITIQFDRDRRGGTAIPDGYPTSTLGAGGSSEHTTT